jgi:pyruvate-formate lyase-activating enzyme
LSILILQITVYAEPGERHTYRFVFRHPPTLTAQWAGHIVSLFLKSCPLACLWCHNPEGLAFGAEVQQRPERCIGCNRCLPPGAEYPALLKLQDRLVEACHRPLTGVSNTPILANLQRFADSPAKLLISLSLIPGLNE